jgi:hypothetical protein
MGWRPKVDRSVRLRTKTFAGCAVGGGITCLEGGKNGFALAHSINIFIPFAWMEPPVWLGAISEKAAEEKLALNESPIFLTAY